MSNEQLRTISLVLLFLIGSLYFYTYRQEKAHDQIARPAAEQLLKQISQWDKQTIFELLSEEARQTLNDEQLSRLVEHYRQFGKLQSIQELKFSKLASALSLLGSYRISYQGSAIYSTGPANITMTLVPAEGGYRIYNFALSR